jgi:LmbE family N-acetylglucosaminyl deacetylase
MPFAFNPTILKKAHNVLFLLAHPDDEILMSGVIQQFVKNDIPVHLAWLTSGDLFGKGKLREKELASAAELLGVLSDNCHLFRLPDMGLIRNLRRVFECTTELVSRLEPSHVFVPAYEGGHPDHDALNFIAHSVWQSMRQSFSLLEFPLYNGTGPFFFLWLRVNLFVPGTGQIEKHFLDSEQIALKIRLIDIYNSQPRSMLPIRLTHWWRRLTRNCAEPYARIPHNRDYQIRPHPGTIFYERFFNKHLDLTFEEFSKAVVDFTPPDDQQRQRSL